MTENKEEVSFQPTDARPALYSGQRQRAQHLTLIKYKFISQALKPLKLLLMTVWAGNRLHHGLNFNLQIGNSK